MRTAVIDIGTNSVKLLIAESGRNGPMRTLREDRVICRIGEGLSRSRRISAAAAGRAMEALERFRRSAARAGAREVVVAATEALRRADNAGAFLRGVRKRFGWTVRVLSAEEEARLAYEAATSDLERPRPAMVDVGGGSTEIVVGSRGVADSWASVRVGCLTLLESDLAKDPPGTAAVERAAARVRRLIPSPPWFGMLVAIGGTAVTAAMMASRRSRNRRPSRVEHLDGFALRREFLDRMIARLAVVPIEFRTNFAGLERDRADIILPGMIILREVMRVLAVSTAIVRACGWRHALAARAARSGTAQVRP
jgi:exopolyphosphatase/guanosine-5'-triphosphate,3'-diphosphate pyrophosphatase